MSENNYGALMMKSALSAETDIDTILEPGIYPVIKGNATIPAQEAGSLSILPGSIPVRFFSSNTVVLASSYYDYTSSVWSEWDFAVSRRDLGSSDPLQGDSLVMHHTGKSVAEYLDLYLATVFFITPEQNGAKGDTVQDDSDGLEDAINKAVATSLMSGGVYTPVVVQLNKPYRITRTITIDASRVRLNAISGCGVYVDPDGTYTDNKVFNITGSGPNAAVAASKVGALFDGVLFLTSGEKKLDLFHAVRDSTASNDNGACLHNVSNIAARGFRTIFTHGAGGWGWNFTGCLFSGNINLMDIITAGDTYERHTFVGCLWGNGGY
ncbi:hypothetical protein QTO67_28740, partial [Klebsiella oxytoca]|nr:hypothetical protein [Klebsiella oxytoca]